MPSNGEKQVKLKLESMGQTEILEALGNLSGEARERLLQQLLSLDPDRFATLRSALKNRSRNKSFDTIQPAPVKRLPHGGEESGAEREAAATGKQALENDRVATLTVAGGQGTRLGYDGPKGAFPITPINKKSLFQYLGEKIKTVRQRYQCNMPWLIMTSPVNHGTTKQFFEDNRFFGINPDSIHFFPQNVNPILNAEGDLVLDENGGLLLGPDGHGGVFEALRCAGLIEELQRENFDLISYFQVDNPLVTVADERFLGHHLLQNAEFSSKVIAKRDPFEGLGLAVLDGGREAIVEYVDLPEEMAVEKTDDGELKYRFGSIAVHILNTAFAGNMATATRALPWHVAEKNYVVTTPRGEKKATRCYKLEKFVFDCLTEAKGCAFVEADRHSEFAPVKNAEGKDSPAECRKMLHAQWMKILNGLGVDLAISAGGGITVEISPLLSCNLNAEIK